MTGVSETMSDVDVGALFLQNHICVHLKTNRQKFDCLVLMAQKLYAVVGGLCEPDNMDAISMHDVVLTGHLYQ